MSASLLYKVTPQGASPNRPSCGTRAELPALVLDVLYF